MELDFSEFHPLDHWPGGAYCRSLPGGTRNHLALTWRFRRKQQLIQPFHRVFRCWWGKHQWALWQTAGANPIVTPQCVYCPATRLPSEQEIDMARERAKRMPWS